MRLKRVLVVLVSCADSTDAFASKIRSQVSQASAMGRKLRG